MCLVTLPSPLSTSSSYSLSSPTIKSLVAQAVTAFQPRASSSTGPLTWPGWPHSWTQATKGQEEEEEGDEAGAEEVGVDSIHRMMYVHSV